MRRIDAVTGYFKEHPGEDVTVLDLMRNLYPPADSWNARLQLRQGLSSSLRILAKAGIIRQVGWRRIDQNSTVKAWRLKE